MFGLSPRVFTARPDEAIGVLYPLDESGNIDIISAGIDSDDPAVYEIFGISMMPGYSPEGVPSWYVVWKGESFSEGVRRYEVPVYVEYENIGTGIMENWKGSFVVYANGETVAKPVIKYIDNIASKVGTTEYVTIHGHGFNDDLDVFLGRPDGSCVKISGTDLYREYNPNGYDTISFIFGDPFVLRDTTCSEVCGTYDINLGYGECGANSLVAGTNDYDTIWDNNLSLIRYRFDSSNKEEMEHTAGGLMATVDPSCFYASELSLVVDDYDSASKVPHGGGVSGKLGQSIYFRIHPGTDCTKIGYYRVKLKYSANLPMRYGEMTLNGVPLNEGDLVWLDKQFDGGDGLWIVQTGEWIGLKTYMDGKADFDGGEHPCTRPTQEPLPVDANVIADLGVHVMDRVSVTCDSDVPEERRYGAQRICGKSVVPGDTVLLTNQSDGTNGIWEVTCAEWIQRTDYIPAHDGSSISGDDFVIVQNDIDFCTCEHGGKNIFHIWYYYLNGACYLSRISRTVKITCGTKGALFPSNKVDVTDYSVTAGANSELVNDSRHTAGDPVQETCTLIVENYDAEHRVGIVDGKYGCGEDELTAPNGIRICRCEHVYNIDANESFFSRDRNGFSIVFWQYDDTDEKWHLYAYIGAGRYDTGMDYYVYHLCTNGIAEEDDVDENRDIVPLDSDGHPSMERTRDAWFVPHGGHLATGFGMFDDTWNFKVQKYEQDGYGETIYDANGLPIPVIDEYAYSHELNAETLYSMWSIRCTTTFCGIRLYKDTSILRKTCKDMTDAETMSSVMQDVMATPDTWGFKLYNDVISKARLCAIWNSFS